MELRSLAEDNIVFVAPTMGENFNMGKLETTWDVWPFKMCTMSIGQGNNTSLTSGVQLGNKNMGQRGNPFKLADYRRCLHYRHGGKLVQKNFQKPHI